jgi:hypothetical protein
MEGKLARNKITNGLQAEARKLWEQSFQLLGRIQGNTNFWREFIQTYNEGKQYLLECTETELEKKIFERIAGLNILLVRDVLETFKAAERPQMAEQLQERLPIAEIIDDTPKITTAPVIDTGDDYQLASNDKEPCPTCGALAWPAEIHRGGGKCPRCS